MIQPPNPATIQQNVSHALQEDIGSGDITAQLIPAEQLATAILITREPAVLCGQAWVEESFRQLDETTIFQWHLEEGEHAVPGQTLLTIQGTARTLLTAERTAMNFLQTLSATATVTHRYASTIADYDTKILDTRKTIPGLREAQKYAVRCGGGTNHRIGLHDAFLIKENHIAACGSIEAAITTARSIAPDQPVEVEVETLEELRQALESGSDIIMLDNFSVEQMGEAVTMNQGGAKLEVSGNVSEDQLAAIAATGVDYVSIGALTKHIQAIDLSMRLTT